jgi:TP901 family phage tail tape measure protein
VGGSEEYLAALGIDTSDVDKAVQQTVTLLGHLGAQFTEVSGKAEKAATNLTGAGRSMGTFADSTKKASASVAVAEQSLPRLRYALYDISNTALIAGTAMLGLSVATAAVAIRFQRQFADVQRTSGATGGALEKLRSDFENLYSSIPVSFEALTRISTIGGQLNISSDRLAEFTEQVAKFSATSDVSVEAAATAFGRLDQLLPDVQGHYQKLSDAVLKVGVNSVATESQIIAIASQLAGVATTARLSSTELIALSGTLASLGTAPELARGAITRLFSNIETAIAGGGERLNAFAAVSGRTAAEFKQDWGSDSFTVIQDVFEGVGESGGNMGLVLRELGITASRDLPVFQKLAQNTDLLAASMDNATNSAGETEKQYGIISSTVAEKLTVLVNNFTLFISKLGEAATGLGSLVDVAIGFLQILQRIAENPIASSIASLALVAGVLSGALLLVFSIMVRTAAASLALRTAMAELGVTSASSALSMRGLWASIAGTGVAARGTTIAVNGLSVGMKALHAATLLLIATELANWARNSIESFRGIRGEAAGLQKDIEGLKGDDLTKKIQGLFSRGGIDEAGLRSSIKNLTDETFGGLANLQADIEGAIGGLAEIGSFGLVDTSLSRVRDNLKEIDTALAAAVSNGNIEAAKAAFNALLQSEAAQGASTADVLSLLPQYSDALGSVATQADNAAGSGEDLAAILADTIGLFTEASKAGVDTQNALYGLGESIGESLDFSDATEEGRANLSNLLQAIDAIAAQTPGDAAAIAANLQGLFEKLVNGAGVSADQLIFLQNIIATLTRQSGGAVAAATISYGSLFQGIATGSAKAAKSAGSAAKQVKTLVDYGNDLKGVFGRAFELRFGNQQGLDEISTGWSKIRDGIASVNSEISKYQQEMMELTSDRAVREYWLSVAEAYGDTLRAGELRAELADIDNKLTAAQADLAKAQAKGSKTLVGNSDAAAENRGEILDLVESYQDYIATLAASGVPQAELQRVAALLRQDFINQATQLGYNSAELQTYAASFDDVSTAIAKVPRNITVGFNGDPALQAMNEFMAKMRSSAGGGVSVPVSIVPDNSGAAQSLKAVRDTYQSQLNAAYAATGGLSNGNTTRLQAAINEINRQIKAMGFRSGTAWTGSGNPWDIAGVVHNREAVLNQRGTQIVGSQFVNAANQGRNPWQYAPARQTKGGSAGPTIMVLDQAQYAGLVGAVERSTVPIASATTLQEAVNMLNQRNADLGGGS